MNISHVVNSGKCTGCSSCSRSCPASAISMEYDRCGFLAPMVDEAACTDCGICVNKCPVEASEAPYEIQESCIVGMAPDELRMKSSSGGFFPALAYAFIDAGGYVAGAAFDENFVLRHKLVHTREDLEDLFESKYVQSDMGDTFSQIQAILEKGGAVLFAGCGCQVAGLKCFLGKDYGELFTVDLICHGVPSPGVFGKYVDELRQRGKIKRISFRDKASLGWQSGMVIWWEDGSKLVEPQMENSYMVGFLNNMYLRESCYDCQFKERRYSDITLGDFWGAGQMLSQASEKGMSAMFLNTKKGEALYSVFENKLASHGVIGTDLVEKSNPSLRHSVRKKVIREKFFENVANNSFSAGMYKTLTVPLKKFDVGLVCWWSKNYGNAMTNFGLYRAVEKLGYSVAVIDSMGYEPEEKFAEFAEKQYNLTSYWTGIRDDNVINNMFDTFCVGSDQVWTYDIASTGSGTYFHCGFVNDDKRKISYASSFGQKDWDAPPQMLPLYKTLLQRFDAISVREAFGVDTCRDKYGVEAAHVLDPVFLADREDYENVIREVEPKESEPFLLTYILSPTPEKVDLVERMQKKLGGIKAVNIADAEKYKDEPDTDIYNGMDVIWNVAPEEWLWYFNNAEFVITDSYHGACFSMIFEKRYICVISRQKSRFDTLLAIDGLKDRIWSDMERDCEKMSEAIDYAKVNEQLDEMREKSRAWLKHALEE